MVDNIEVMPIEKNRVIPARQISVTGEVEDAPIEKEKYANYVKEIYSCIEEMAKYPERAKSRFQTVEKNLKALKDPDRLHHLTKEAEEKRKGETVLHTAVRIFKFKSQEEKDVIKLLISVYPILIKFDRKSTEYAGQTPLHMAVCKSNIWLVKTLLKQLCKTNKEHWKSTLLKRRATGTIFSKTVMMGQVPLSVAALTFNRGIFDLLLNEGADLDGKNSLGDNVCHSLISTFILKVGECQEVRRYDNTIRQRKKMERYMLEVRSLQDEDGDEEGTISTSWGFGTAVLNALKNNKRGSTDRPLSGISDKIRHPFKKMSKKKAMKKDADDDKQGRILEPSEQRPEQIQPPASHDFGLNLRQAEIDIYHVNLCRQCSTSDVTRDSDLPVR